MLPGSKGEDVRDVQTRLGALGYSSDPDEHGVFGLATETSVREFQQRRGLMVDGKVGPDTWAELVEAGYSLGDRLLYLSYPYHRGDDVRTLQSRLNLLGFDAGRQDGIFGEHTDRAVREFQANVGLPQDGIVGVSTVVALTRLRPVGAGPGRSYVREGESLRRLAPGIRDVPIAIDFLQGEEEPGAVGPTALTEREATLRLAEALGRELEERAAAPLLLRTNASEASISERARAANDAGAALLVALRLNAHEDPRAEGASTYYYGRDDYVSPAGQRLAELLLEELTSKLGLKDGRAHPKALPLLRETRMPAVHVEPCFITNPREEALLRGIEFPAAVARALADGMERFFTAS